MTQSPCWLDLEIGRILKPDAEEIPDHIFKFVHCPTELKVADTCDGERILFSPEKFVERFLDPRHDYVQTVVVGESGSGKSHLIQWLRLQIPEDPQTLLLTVPKTGTSLRGIVKRLIDRLPEEERSTYARRLAEAGNNAATHQGKVDKFLDALAWAVEHSGIATEPEDIDLCSLLPDVLRDPNFRRGFFLIPGSTVDHIVQHVFVDPALRDTNKERRGFQLGDLPLDGSHYLKASHRAKEAIDFITGEPGMDTRAIDLLNRTLNAAIGQTLNFSADHLIELMSSLRRHLAKQGKRLILLIEDFARLQGIDSALLQALITPPGQGEERLCEIRWAMAVTTGYFRPMPQTVRTRTTLLVDMDLSKPVHLSRLAAGYMNALRFGETRLKDMAAVPLSEGSSCCAGCEKKVACFAAFGERDDIGLFPFTDKAIQIMSRRSEALTDSGLFNPRLFLRSVLQSVLQHEFRALEQGEFPSPALLARIGGSNAFAPMSRDRLMNMDHSYHSRRLTLLELWSGSGNIVNLPDGIHEAFGIPMLKIDGREPGIEDDHPTDGPTEPAPPPQPGVPVEIQKLRRWASDKGIMPQDLTTELRERVFAAVEAFIDWDRIGIRKKILASPKAGAFRRVSINFSNQQTSRMPSLVTLEIETRYGSALEALLLHKHHGGWDFPASGEYLASLLEALDEWALEVNGQISKLYLGTKEWNPAVAAAELLLIAALQSGKVKISDSQLEKVVTRLWEESAPSRVKALHRGFTDVAGVLVDAWPQLLELLRNLCSGMKGGITGNFVRATPVLRAVRTLRQRSLQLSQVPPEENPTSELRDLAALYRSVQEKLLVEMAQERLKWGEWLVSVQEEVGQQTFVAILDSINEAINEVETEGLNCGGSRGVLKTILATTRPALLDRAFDHAKALPEANATEFLIRLASIGEARDSIDQLLKGVETFVENAEATIANERVRLETETGAGLKESEERIEAGLNAISGSLDLLCRLSGGSK